MGVNQSSTSGEYSLYEVALMQLKEEALFDEDLLAQIGPPLIFRDKDLNTVENSDGEDNEEVEVITPNVAPKENENEESNETSNKGEENQRQYIDNQPSRKKHPSVKRVRIETSDSFNNGNAYNRDRFESNNSYVNVNSGWASSSPSKKAGEINKRDRTFTNAFRGGITNRIGLNQVSQVIDTSSEEKISNGDSVVRLVNNVFSIATWAATIGDEDNTNFEVKLACRCHALFLMRNKIYKDIEESNSRNEEFADQFREKKKNKNKTETIKNAHTTIADSLLLNFSILTISMLKTIKETSLSVFPRILNSVEDHVSSFPPLSLLDSIHFGDSTASSVDSICEFLMLQLSSLVDPSPPSEINPSHSRNSSNFNNDFAELNRTSIANLNSEVDDAMWGGLVRCILHLALARGKLHVVLFVIEKIIWRAKALNSSTKAFKLESIFDSFISIENVDLKEINSFYFAGANDFGELCIPIIAREISNNNTFSIDNTVAEAENAEENNVGDNVGGKDNDNHGNNNATTSFSMPSITYNFGKVNVNNYFAENEVDKVYAGLNVSFFQLKNGLVYSCGSNDKGQCGQGNLEILCFPPRPISSLRDKIITQISISSSGSSVCFLSSEGDVYSCGFNSRGQLGQGYFNNLTFPRIIDSLKGPIIHISSGSNHVGAISADGRVSMWGDNEYGQLGIGSCDNKTRPVEVPFLFDKDIKSIALGLHHSVFLSAKGIYASGRNHAGQLGLNHTADRSTPHLVPELDDISIVSIATSSHSTMLLSSEGGLYVFGNNEKGQLGVGDRRNRIRPTRVRSLETVEIESVHCASDYAVAVTKDCKLYTWGENLIDHTIKDKPVFLHSGEKKIQIALGDSHLIANSITNKISSSLSKLKSDKYSDMVMASNPCCYFRFADEIPCITIKNHGKNTFLEESNSVVNGVLVNCEVGFGETFLRHSGPFRVAGDNLFQNRFENNSSFAVNFGGSGYIHVPYVERNNFRSVLTVELWAKCSPSKSSGKFLLSSGATAFNNGYSCIVTDSSRWGFKFGTSLLLGPFVEENKWAHILATYNGADFRVSFYVNGVLCDASTLSPTYSSNISHPLHIGSDEYGDNRFVGSMAEVAIYASLFSSNSARKHYDVGIDIGTKQEVAVNSPIVSTFANLPKESNVSIRDASLSNWRPETILQMLKQKSSSSKKKVSSSHPLYPAIVLMAHIDRLSSKFVPQSENNDFDFDEIRKQSHVVSTLLAPLAIDVDAKTFELLHDILQRTSEMYLIDNSISSVDDGGFSEESHLKTYLLLSVLRVIGAHFHQMVLNQVDPQEIGLINQNSGLSLMDKIRAILFSLSDHKDVDDEETSEIIKVVQNEAMQVLSVGFGVMFPTAVDKALFLGEMLKRSLVFSPNKKFMSMEGIITPRQLGKTESMLLSMQLPQLVETEFWSQLFKDMEAKADAKKDAVVLFLTNLISLLSSDAIEQLQNLVTNKSFNLSSNGDDIIKALRVAQRTILCSPGIVDVINASGSGDEEFLASKAEILSFESPIWNVFTLYLKCLVSESSVLISKCISICSEAEMHNADLRVVEIESFLEQSFLRHLVHILLVALYALPVYQWLSTDLLPSLSELLVNVDKLKSIIDDEDENASLETNSTVTFSTEMKESVMPSVPGKVKLNINPHLTVETAPNESSVLKSDQQAYKVSSLDDISWIIDFEKTLSWLVGRFAACSVRGDSLTNDEIDNRQWLKSVLFKGGMDGDQKRFGKETEIFSQIIAKEGAGKQLVEKLESANPPPLLLRSLMNNPNINTVVRALFAVLLKHSPTVISDMDKNLSGVSEYVEGLWKKARDIAKYMSQQHQALSIPYFNLQDALVNKAKFLLSVSPLLALKDKNVKSISRAVEEGWEGSPVPNKAAPSPYASLNSVKQLRESISVRGSIAEDEEEFIHKEILSFFQAEVNEKDLNALIDLRQRRASGRIKGLNYFAMLMKNIEYTPARHHLVRCFAASFERPSSDTHRIHKDHYLSNLEGSGIVLTEEVTKSFFSVLSMITNHITAGGADNAEKILVFDACTMPYNNNDFIFLQSSAKGLLDILLPLLSWDLSSSQYVEDSTSSVTGLHSKRGKPEIPALQRLRGDHSPTKVIRNEGMISSPVSAVKEKKKVIPQVDFVKEGFTNGESSIYSFGQNTYGELIHSDTDERHAPAQVQWAVGKFPIQVAVGNEFTAILTSDGEVYTCGYNKYGSCGVNQNKHRILIPTLVQGLQGKAVSKIISAHGCEQLMFILGTGELYSCGFNAQGQLGHSDTNHASLPKLVGGDVLKGKRVLQAACSYRHMLILTEDDEVYAFGQNNSGQCGLGHRENVGSTATLVTDLSYKNIISIACGYYHSLACDTKGDVYCFGKNDYGQLGIGKELYGENKEDDVALRSTCVPTLIATSTALKGRRPVQVFAGYYHSGVLAADGTLHMFGRNDYGQCGQGHRDNVLIAKPVTSLSASMNPGVSVRDVSLGTYTTFITTSDNQAFGFGRNRCGQLGDGTTDDALRAVKLNIMSNSDMMVAPIISVRTGFHHTVVLSGVYEEPIAMSNKVPLVDKSLLKLSNAAWSFYRLLLYTSTNSGGVLNEFASILFSAIMEELQRVSATSFFLQQTVVSKSLSVQVPFGASGLSNADFKGLDAACVGWLRAYKQAVESSSSIPSALAKTLMSNQLLWVLSRLCYVNDSISKMLASPNYLKLLFSIAVSITRGSGLKKEEDFLLSGATLALRCLRKILRFVPAQEMDQLILDLKSSKGVIDQSLFPLDFSDSKVNGYTTVLLLLNLIGRSSYDYILSTSTPVVGDRNSMVYATEIVSLVRILITTSSWGGIVNRVIISTLSNAGHLNQDLAALVRSPNDILLSQRYWSLVGAISSLGGFSDILRSRCKVRLMIGNLEQDGILVRHTPENPNSVCKVRLMGGYDHINVKDEADLLALPDISVPVDAFTDPDRILALLHEVIEQSSQHGLEGNDLHLFIRTNACKALDTLLQHPPIIGSCVKQGYFASLAALLASPPKELSSITLPALERRLYEAEQLKRVTIISSTEVHPSYQTPTTAMLLRNKQEKRDGIKFKQDDLSPREDNPRYNVQDNSRDDEGGENNDNNRVPEDSEVISWICDLCTYKNEIGSRECRMCASEKPQHITSSLLVDERKVKIKLPFVNSPHKKSEPTLIVPYGTDTSTPLVPDTALSFVRTWDFNGRVMNPVESKLVIMGANYSWKNDRIGGIEKSVLELHPGTFISLNHGFQSFSSSNVYVNEYTVVLDVKFMDYSDRNYTSILKCGYDKTVDADWYVKKDGSSGCVKYGGSIKKDNWHRLAMVADIGNKSEKVNTVTYYLDGVQVSRLVDNFGAVVKVDDRWSLDISCSLFLDREMSDMGIVRISSCQLRNYAMNEAEIERMGGSVASGVPEPSKGEAATLLSDELNIPRYWCLQALSFVGGHRLQLAREWLKKNKDTLRARSEAEAASLTCMGYPLKLAKKALLATGNRTSAIQWLLNATAQKEKDLIMRDSDWILEPLKEVPSGSKTGPPLTLSHPGTWNGTEWMCCNSTESKDLGCTDAGGRSSGALSEGLRVHRGPNWKWGNQDGGIGSFGTVVQVTSWSSSPRQGVRVKWDNGHTNVYRWGYSNNFDVTIIAEGALAGNMNAIGTEGEAAGDNPTYRILDNVGDNHSTAPKKDGEEEIDDKETLSYSLPTLRGMPLERLQSAARETSQMLFMAYARHAIVSLLEHSDSTSVSGKASVLSRAIFTLLNNDNLGGERHFLRNYLLAFSDSLDPAKRDGGLSINVKDPVSIMYTKLWKVMKEESIALNEEEDGKANEKWESSLARVVTEEALYELLLLSSSSTSLLPCGLQAILCTSFELAWRNDKNNNVEHMKNSKVSFWHPMPAEGYFILGDVCMKGWREPAKAMCVMDDNSGLICKPLSFKCIFANDHVSLWKMVPPDGFVAMGYVAHCGASSPDVNRYRVVRDSVAQQSCVGHSLWSQSSSAIADFASIWQVDNASNTFILSSTPEYPFNDDAWHLGRASHSGELGNPNLVLYLLQLLVAFDSEDIGLSSFRSYVFRPELIHALFCFVRTAAKSQKVRALRTLAAVLRRTPSSALTPPVVEELIRMREIMDRLYTRQKTGGFFSTYLQAVVEVMVSIGLMQRETKLIKVSEKTKVSLIEEEASNVKVNSIVSKQEWFNQLLQVANILEALKDRSKNLPQDFMLADDMFLNLILVDETFLIESPHTYTRGRKHEGTITIPNAVALELKFDGRCSTEVNDGLAIYKLKTDSEAYTTYQGPFGAQDLKIEGNTFSFKFPVENEFNWRLDRQRKGRNFELSFDDRVASYTLNKNWQSIVSTGGFTKGINSWEIRIDKTTAAGNIFVGVCKAGVNLNSYLGKDNIGWGWIGCMTLWHDGKKVKSNFGTRVKNGDIVKVTLDLNKGRMSIGKNGTDFGVAFDDLPPGVYFPAFSMYNLNDKFTLISGTKTEMTHQVDAEVVPDDVIPAERLEKAKFLQGMGYPVAWCARALAAVSDDMELAADYLLAHASELEAEFAAEAEMKTKQIRAQVERSELSWMMAMAGAEDDDATDAVTRASENIASNGKKGVVSGTGKTAPGVIPSVSITTNKDRKSEGGPSGTVSATIDSRSASGRSKEWGYRCRVIPKFPADIVAKNAMLHAERLERFNVMFQNWTVTQDEELVQYLNDHCDKIGIDPLHMNPQELNPTADDLLYYPTLESSTIQDIQIRFLLLRNFNRRLAGVLSVIDLSCEDHESFLARTVRHLRGLIFRAVKMTQWNLVLTSSNLSTPDERPAVSLDRNRAANYVDRRLHDNKGQHTIFGQLFQQLNKVQPRTLRDSERAWHVTLSGEFADDYGGPYRESISILCRELHSPVLPLLMQCPNGRVEFGQNKEKFIPNPTAITPSYLEMYEFIGKLFGIAMRTRNPMDISLPSLIWKRLVKQPVEFSDVGAIDKSFARVLENLLDMEKEGVTEETWPEIASELNLCLTCQGSDGKDVPLVTGGTDIPVTWGGREEYISMLKQFRIEEFGVHCASMARGVATQVPFHLLHLFTWSEMQLMVCGRPTIDVELLKENTEYGELLNNTTPLVLRFWRVLRDLSEFERQLYLRFVWGRSRLPLSSAEFPRKHKINILNKTNPDDYFPVAHTCFFSIDWPNYSTDEIARKRLLYAITHCQSIDADDTTNARRAAVVNTYNAEQDNGSDSE